MTTETTAYETLGDRELDALIAERVMGLTLPSSWVALYSTKPGAAFTVLEAMRAKGYFVGISGTDERWEAERWNASLHHRTRAGAIVAHDPTMPRAVCIAALRALDAEAGHPPLLAGLGGRESVMSRETELEERVRALEAAIRDSWEGGQSGIYWCVFCEARLWWREPAHDEACIVLSLPNDAVADERRRKP